MLIIEGSGSGKTITSRILINCEPDTDKIYLYVKDPCKVKYECLVHKSYSTGLKYLNDSIACWYIEYSNDIDDIYKNIAE